MTKILYIPTGTYIKWYNGSDLLTTEILEDVIKAFPKEYPNGISDLVADIFNGDEPGDPEWYEAIGVEYEHVFLENEIEVIND